MGVMINTIRFAVSPDSINGSEAVIEDAAIVHQIAHVLRRKAGDRIVLFDGSGSEFISVIRSIDTMRIICAIEDRRCGEREARMRISLYFSLLKSDKNDILIQKCAELGVASFVPVSTARTVVTSLSAAKRSRLTAIVREATELSGGVHIPVIHEMQLFADALASLSPGDTGIIAYEGRTDARLTDYRAAGRLSLFIGPEGGYTDDEIALARQRGVTPVTLGSRILRAETAAIGAVAALLL
ncbi:MAG: RsmE family RNA methyltransferase [Spirochaetota bacterium]